jgi:hypothetical protein
VRYRRESINSVIEVSEKEDMSSDVGISSLTRKSDDGMDGYGTSTSWMY